MSEKISLPQFLKQRVFRETTPPEKELSELLRLFHGGTCSREETLIMAGEPWDRAFFIHEGIMRLYYTDREGREYNKAFFSEGELVWPVAPSAQREKIRFTIAPLENLKLSVCSFRVLQSWLKEQNYWEPFALSYAEAFAEEKFIREYEFLMHSAPERFQHFCEEHPQLAERIPDYHLASYLGMTNVSLSRIKNS